MQKEQRHIPFGWLCGAAVCLSALVLTLVLSGFGRVSAVFLPETAVPASGMTSGQTVVPLGRTVGIKLFSDGVVVVGLSDLETQAGTASPGRTCGLRAGDIITHINGQDVDTIEQVQRILKEDGQHPLTLQTNRLGKTLHLTTQAIPNEQGHYQLGVWLRDSMAGIGTMTFYDPKTGAFAALGHGINDMDTAQLMPLESGSIMYATVSDVKKGVSGSPGELHGSFDVNRDLGVLSANTSLGIYGMLTAQDHPFSGQEMQVARRQEVKEGPATILSNVSGDIVEEFDVEILQIYPVSAEENRSFMLQVTDPDLLIKTGGIVQGMSGSPICQNGKIVGAVTHVLVNDPTRGYGIFIENMLDAAS